MSPALFVAAHPDDETLAMSVAIAEHVAAGQDVHLLWLTAGEASGVRGKLNGTSPTPNSWWGAMHSPADEGYEELDAETFGAARLAEATAAVRALTSGLGSITIHPVAGLPDGGVTQSAAEATITAVADAIGPGPVRLKGHTWVTQLDNHPDHIAVGAAIKQLGVDDQTRFADRRYYLLPAYWSDPDLSLVTEVWDLPSDAGIAARAVNACRAYGAWAPDVGRFAIGHHSVSSLFNNVIANPRCLFHA